jgi:GNAT superfamily N-acetyltransferase
MRLAQIADLARSNGWSSVLKEMIFFHRTAIVVEKDLWEIADRPEALASSNLRVVEIDRQMLASGVYHFAIKSRRLKALHHLKRGYVGLALVRNDNVVIGDTWSWASESTDDPRRLHVDLPRFGFKSWLKSDVYTFDIFVAPEERKGGISAAFQNSAMLFLRSRGYTRAFGFYWADNIPAHWCTRVTNKWKKLREARASRFMIFTRTVPLMEERAVPQAGTGSVASVLLATEEKREPDYVRAADESADQVQECVRQ